MDGLWDPPYYEETEETFSFCHPYDVIEETNINMKCCIQVLELLISKADDEILEHEEELMDLLSQLALTDKVFSDMFSMCLRSKIDFLDASIRKLKNDAESEDFLSTSREPAESTYDILKSLFCGYLQKKDLQFADNTSSASSSNCQVPPVDNQKKQIGSSSNANQMEKVKAVNIIPVEKPTISMTIVKVEEENTNYHYNISLPLCWGSTKKTNREVRKFITKSPIIMKKDIMKKKTPKCNSISPKPSLETQGKSKHQLTVVKSQTYDESMSLATVPYQEPSKESNAMIPYVEPHEEPNAMIPYVEPHEEPNAKQLIIKEADYPPGYPNPQRRQKESISHSRSPYYSARTYKRRKQPNSPPLQTSSNPCRALVVGNPLDRAETYSNLYKEDYYYTVTDLRAIAKQQNLKGYYKLRKAELARSLGIKLIEGRRKQPKRKETQLVPMIKCEP